MSKYKNAIKAFLGLTPYRLSRTPPNRFDAVHLFLKHLSDIGFVPGVIIDAGAHLGAFATAARRVFPNAEIHMIEPQPMCAPALREIAAQRGFFFHPVALTDAPKPVRMVFEGQISTGAHVSEGPDQSLAEVTGDSLDRLFGTLQETSGGILLKLDLQGHEIAALEGGKKAFLKKVDIVISESSFLNSKNFISTQIAFMDAAGFDLFDIVGLHGRQRDDRAREADLVFIRRETTLCADRSWA